MLLKTMLSDKKIPLILPLLDNNNFISNFKKKVNFSMNIDTNKFFDKHYYEKCSLIQHRSILTSLFTALSHKSLSSIQFLADIKSLTSKQDAWSLYN